MANPILKVRLSNEFVIGLFAGHVADVDFYDQCFVQGLSGIFEGAIGILPHEDIKSTEILTDGIAIIYGSKRES